MFTHKRIDNHHLSERNNDLSGSHTEYIDLNRRLFITCLHDKSEWTSFVIAWHIADHRVQVSEAIGVKYRELRMLEFASNFLVQYKPSWLFIVLGCIEASYCDVLQVIYYWLILHKVYRPDRGRLWRQMSSLSRHHLGKNNQTHNQ
jgi:hypothetical protein